MYIFPAQVTKTLKFNRMNSKHVKAYEIYVSYKDDTYPDGIRIEKKDTIDNIPQTEPILKRIELKYNTKATWKMPGDLLLDIDHKFKIYMNEELLSPMAYMYNRYKKIVAIDTVIQSYTQDDKIELEYYQDIITYTFTDDKEICDIFVKPIFTEYHLLGNHNVIM